MTWQITALSTGLQIKLAKIKTTRTAGIDETLGTLSGSQIADIQSFKCLDSMVNSLTSLQRRTGATYRQPGTYSFNYGRLSGNGEKF